jgi:hypothetical protein
MPDKEEQCGDCRFWARRTDNARQRGGGYCMRFPPIFRNDALNDGWPNTHQQSWCGEFQPGRHRWNPKMEELEQNV